MKQKVVIGLSGGVDSSVAAYLLKEKGYEVIGIFMRNWQDTSVTKSAACPWIEDSQDALLVAEKLDIPFQVIDFSDQYKKSILDYMFEAYQKGFTPNPDILCNREIKFAVFLEKALQLGADFVATGHYARNQFNPKTGLFELLAGVDQSKDQSYFLCQLDQKQLAKALFPIGHLQKKQVREIAQKLDLVTAQKKDSQGLCFVGHIDLPTFLKQKLSEKKGEIILLPQDLSCYKEKKDPYDYAYQKTEGKVIGQHNGAHFYTIGQRKGLGVGGLKSPIFVLQIDTKNNILYVGEGTDHPGLYRPALWLKKIHFLDPYQKITEKMDVQVRIRYRQALEKAVLIEKKEHFEVYFECKQRAIAKGQFVAFYEGEKLIASGEIE